MQNTRIKRRDTSLFKVAVKTEAARPGIRTIGRQDGVHDGVGGGGAALEGSAQRSGSSSTRMRGLEEQ
jgi:hypothetical protein